MKKKIIIKENLEETVVHGSAIYAAMSMNADYSCNGFSMFGSIKQSIGIKTSNQVIKHFFEINSFDPSHVEEKIFTTSHDSQKESINSSL